MRKIDEMVLNAVENKGNLSVSNTHVATDSTKSITRVYLHGNLIAKYDHRTGKRYFNMRGWNSNTTRSRLNALGADVRQRNFKPVFNGQVIKKLRWYEF